MILVLSTVPFIRGSLQSKKWDILLLASSSQLVQLCPVSADDCGRWVRQLPRNPLKLCTYWIIGCITHGNWLSNSMARLCKLLFSLQPGIQLDEQKGIHSEEVPIGGRGKVWCKMAGVLSWFSLRRRLQCLGSGFDPAELCEVIAVATGWPWSPTSSPISWSYESWKMFGGIWRVVMTLSKVTCCKSVHSLWKSYKWGIWPLFTRVSDHQITRWGNKVHNIMVFLLAQSMAIVLGIY